MLDTCDTLSARLLADQLTKCYLVTELMSLVPTAVIQDCEGAIQKRSKVFHGADF